MADDLKNVGLVFKADGAIDFKKSLKDITLELQKNYNQFKLTQAQWDDSTTSTQKLIEQQKYLQNAYQIQTNKVSVLRGQIAELESAENKNVSAIKKKRNELANAELKLKKYGNQLEEIEKSLKNTGKAIEEYGKKIEEVGSKIENVGNKVTAFSAATGAAFLASAKTAIDFETAFTGVEKTVNGTEEQLAELKQGIRDMAKEMPSSTTEISAVAEAAGQLGIQTENILGFSKAMINLGNSTNLSAEEAASELAKFANIMQMSQKDFDKLGSSIVDLGNNFATTEADIVSMAMRLAGAGKQVGLSEGEVLGLATALSSVGIEAEMGGSAISKAMVKMQNAVENGGKKLDDLKKKTGMSLRELELLASNSSMDFKYLCNDIGMTSTEVKNLITAGTNLEDFARISGKTSEEFKKDWKEDAIGALSEFIQGLGNAEEKGESAITMLTDMGLTEVRLRDSLLRAANAGNLFSKAIEKGNEAFEDNTALANEANKRYATLESKINMALNKAKDLALTFGNKLTPALDKGLDKIDELSETVGNLTDEQVEFILKVGAAVVALGPLIKITGKVISVGGTAIKMFGTLTTAVGVASGTITTTSTAVMGLAKVFTAISSPAGVAVTVIAGVTTAIIALKKANDNEIDSIKNKIKTIEEEKLAYDEFKQKQQEQIEANLAEASNIERLRDELKLLVDDNGKVKDGYKGRVDFILKELNNALGTEYSRTNDVINKYNELSNSIDLLIEKKKANIILDSKEEGYSKALKEQQNALKELGKYQEDLFEYQKKLDFYEKAVLNAETVWDKVDAEKNVEEYEKLVQNTQNAYDKQKEIIKNYYKDIADYESTAALIQEGTAESLKKVNDSVAYSYMQSAKESEKALSESISKCISSIDTYKDAYKENQSEITKNQQNESEKRLEELAQELANSTSVINNNSDDVENAWKNLAQNSYTTYCNVVDKLPEDLKLKIQNITGILTTDTTIKMATGQLSQSAIDAYDNNIKKMNKIHNDNIYITAESIKNNSAITNANGNLANNALASFEAHLNTMSNIANDKISDTSDIINNDTKVSTAAALLAGKAHDAVLSNDSNAWGQEMVERLGNGITTKSNGSWFNGVLNSLSGKISSRFKGVFTSNNSSNLPGHKLGLEYVPKDNYIARLHKGERVLTKEENKDYTEAIEDKRPVTSKTNTNYQNSNVVFENIIDYDKLTNCFITAISKIGLFIDENTLVGHTAPKMNQALAVIKEKEERGG